MDKGLAPASFLEKLLSQQCKLLQVNMDGIYSDHIILLSTEREMFQALTG